MHPQASFSVFSLAHYINELRATVLAFRKTKDLYSIIDYIYVVGMIAWFISLALNLQTIT